MARAFQSRTFSQRAFRQRTWAGQQVADVGGGHSGGGLLQWGTRYILPAAKPRPAETKPVDQPPEPPREPVIAVHVRLDVVELAIPVAVSLGRIAGELPAATALAVNATVGIAVNLGSQALTIEASALMVESAAGVAVDVAITPATIGKSELLAYWRERELEDELLLLV